MLLAWLPSTLCCTGSIVSLAFPSFPQPSTPIQAAHVLYKEQSEISTTGPSPQDQPGQDQMMDSAEQKVIGIAVAAEAAGRPCCVECRTTATPMWRGGPTGPRSLCNACGIRYRKKRRQELGLDNNNKHQQQQQQPPQQQHHQRQDHSEATSAVKDNKSSSLQVVKKRRVLMGVEEAAILLMALSSSSRSTLLHG